mgnify:CR=1 FL=1
MNWGISNRTLKDECGPDSKETGLTTVTKLVTRSKPFTEMAFHYASKKTILPKPRPSDACDRDAF